MVSLKALLLVFNISINTPYFRLNLSICLSVYLSICISVYLPICLFIYLSIYLSVYLSIYFCLSLYMSFCLSFKLTIYQSMNQFISLSFYPSICFLSIWLSVYLSYTFPSMFSFDHLTVFLCVCLSFCFSMYLSIINTNNNRTKSIDLGKFMILDSDQRFKKWQFFR